MVFVPVQKLSGLSTIQDPVAGGVWKIKLECLCKWWQVSFSLRMKKKKTAVVKVVIQTSVFFRYWGAKWNKCDKCYEFPCRLRDNHTTVLESFVFIPFLTELMAVLPKNQPFLVGSILSHSRNVHECDLSKSN